MPIRNGSSIPLNQTPQGTVPNMAGALSGWMQNMVFTLIAQVVNGVFTVTETPTNIAFQGVWQPFTAQQLMIKPEGERGWKWFTVHTLVSLPAKLDDVITYRGTQYRIKEKLDYSEYGYFEYHLVEDYTGSGPNP